MNDFILDTDVCIYWLNGGADIENEIRRVGLERVAITVITQCELAYGAHKSGRPEANLAVLDRLCSMVRVVHTNNEVAETYGSVKAALEREGRRLDDADLLIASIAVSLGATLITNNLRNFDGVPGLRLENWKSQSKE